MDRVQQRRGECDMIYRLLALNIDGTLLYNNGKIAKGLRETIEFVKEKMYMLRYLRVVIFNPLIK